MKRIEKIRKNRNKDKYKGIRKERIKEKSRGCRG